MKRFIQVYQFARLMGIRYTGFRIFYELKRRTGLLKKSFPTNPSFKHWITLEQWREQAPSFFFESRNDFNFPAPASGELLSNAKRILDGEVQFFNGKWQKIESDDWLTNICTNHQYDIRNHWTEIPDFHPTQGDIKYVWERSRFSFLQTILRYDAHTGADSSEWVFTQIESWLDHNPINQGPNYRCSQETSLRIFNWTLAIYFYRYAKGLSEQRFQKIIFSLYWQLRHVRENINFSRIAVRNNHAITETLALYTAGLLFPFFEDAREWKQSGKKWFEEEIAYQIYEDGGYLQFSFNYQRVVIQLLTWAVALAHRHHDKFSEIVYQRAHASLNLLLHSQDAASGRLPNYGSNDGSLFFQWNDQAFSDFRPSLDALHYALTGTNAYATSYEDRNWFGLNTAVVAYKSITANDGVHSFSEAGVYVYRHNGFMVWIACTDYKHRPHQADALHVDIWDNGENLLCDGGSYMYNTTVDKEKYFFGTESHNTVMIANEDQMIKGPRFIWLNWTKREYAKWSEENSMIIFEAKTKVYRHIGKVTHNRKLIISREHQHLTVHDHIDGINEQAIRQLWHVPVGLRNRVKITAALNSGAPERIEVKRFAAPTYGVLEEVAQLELVTHKHDITTQITFL